MSDQKPLKTRYSSTDLGLLKIALSIEDNDEQVNAKMASLQKELKVRAEEIIKAHQDERAKLFTDLGQGLGIPEADWGNGEDWSLFRTDLQVSEATLVHNADELRNSEMCHCLACTLRRAIADGDHQNEAGKIRPQKPLVH